jgi:methylated-DNA-[protein]-cysteine S-methyltransferase
MKLLYETVPTPIGETAIVWRKKGGARTVARVLFSEGTGTVAEQVLSLYPNAVHTAAVGGPVRGFIVDLLRGIPVRFGMELLEWEQCSEFQRHVLLKTGEIPRGLVASYGRLAELIGAPRAARAVGTALAGNPFPFFIPCHRVVRSTGDLGQFGGGPKLKKTLLEIEGVSFEGLYRVNSSCMWTGEGV